MASPTFGTFLRRLILARMPVVEFRRLVGISPQYLSKILAGQTPMPLRRVAQFAALLVDGAEARERFTLAAQITHAPADLGREFLRLRPDVLQVVPLRNPGSRRDEKRGRPAGPRSGSPRRAPRSRPT